MKWNGNDAVEISAAQTPIAHRFLQPFRHGMSQMQLAIIFELQNDKTNHAAAAISGDGGIEGEGAMCAIGTVKLAVDRSWKWL